MYLFVIFIVLSVDNSSFVDKIPQIISQHIGSHMGIRMYRGHDESCVIKFEKDSYIGILYLTDSVGKCIYNYVRYDTFGNMIMDLRNIKSTPPITGSVNIENMDLTVPCADYVIDEEENIWLFYIDAFDNVYNRYVAWLKIDKNGHILEDNKSRQWITGQFYALPSKKHKWYLFLEHRQFFGSDPLGDRIVNYNMKSPRKLSMGAAIELNNGNLLIINRGGLDISYSIVNDKGQIKYKTKKPIALDKCAAYVIPKIGIVADIDLFNYNDTILVACAIYNSWDPEEVRTDLFYMIKFDKNGKLIYPKQGFWKGKILPIEEMPANTKLAIAFTAYGNLDRLWVYGCDGQGNLYLKYWSHKTLEQYIK